MVSRRTLLATVGGAAALGGCLSGADAGSDPEADQPATDDTEPVDAEPPDTTDPITTTRLFYEALVTGDKAALNEWFVHPESPTYPIEDHHLPPERFEPVETVQIASMEAVSVQDRVVQQLYPDVSRSSRTRREMGASRLQYVHTTFYVTLTDDAAPQQANESDEIAVDNETVDAGELDDDEIEVEDGDDADDSEGDNTDPTVYVAETVDYLVRDDGQWYVRYDAT